MSVQLIKSVVARCGLASNAQLVRGSAIALALTVCGQGTMFALQTLLARLLGPGGYGDYSIAMSWYSMVVPVAKLGFDVSLLGFVSRYVASADYGLAAGVSFVGRAMPTLFGLALALIGSAVVLGSGEFHSTRTQCIALAWLLVPLSVYSELSSTLLRAFKSIGIALVGDSLIRPAIAVAVVVAVYVRVGSVDATVAIGAFGVGTLAVLVFNARNVRLAQQERQLCVERVTYPIEWIAVSLPLMFAGGLQAILYALDTIILGAMGSSTEAGIFAMASRLALVTLLAMNAIQMMAAPMLADAMSRGLKENAQSIVTLAVRLALLVSAAYAALVVLFGRDALNLLGSAYDAAYVPLLLLLVAQLINVGTGPVGFVLAFSGQQHRLVVYLAVAVLISLAGNIYAAPRFGAVGSACIALLAHVTWNGMASWYCSRNLGIHTGPRLFAGVKRKFAGDQN